jgi:Flp pilus assembly protein TadD
MTILYSLSFPFIASRMARSLVAIAACAAANGCASLKEMTADFDNKWDDPHSILEAMDETSSQNRATNSSWEKMAAFNESGCAKKFGLLDQKSDKATLSSRQISAAECMLDSGKDEDAAKLFGLAAESGGDAAALQGKGVALVRLGRYADATMALQAAIDLDPDLWRAWNALGVAEDYAGDQEKAWSSFRKASALNPSDGAALNNLGVSLLKAERHDEAVEAFKQALAVNGARDAAEANLRLAYALDGDYTNSVKSLPQDRRASALNNAGVAAATRGDKAEARKLFNRALEESPHFYAKAYNNLSLLVE